MKIKMNKLLAIMLFGTFSAGVAVAQPKPALVLPAGSDVPAVIADNYLIQGGQSVAIHSIVSGPAILPNNWIFDGITKCVVTGIAKQGIGNRVDISAQKLVCPDGKGNQAVSNFIAFAVDAHDKMSGIAANSGEGGLSIDQGSAIDWIILEDVELSK